MASKAVTPFDLLGCQPPSKAQQQAIRAVGLGTATEGQQKLAMAYVLGELCGLGSIPFIVGNEHWSSFRAGSQAVGQAICAIGGANIATFARRVDDDEADR